MKAPDRTPLLPDLRQKRGPAHGVALLEGRESRPGALGLFRRRALGPFRTRRRVLRLDHGIVPAFR
jgi:hypothetical protein